MRLLLAAGADTSTTEMTYDGEIGIDYCIPDELDYDSIDYSIKCIVEDSLLRHCIRRERGAPSPPAPAPILRPLQRSGLIRHARLPQSLMRHPRSWPDALHEMPLVLSH